MMFLLLYASKFKRKLKRLVKKNPKLKQRIDRTLKGLEHDPFEPFLQSHKAQDTKGRWTYSAIVTKDLRIIWNYHKGRPRVLDILDIGGHSGKRKVYR